MKGMDRERGESVRTFVEFEPGMRGKIAAAIDGLLAVLDQIDGDADVEDDELGEPDADEEPSLASTEARFLDLPYSMEAIRILSADQRRSCAGSRDDREQEFDGREDGHDAEHDKSDCEPSLGATLDVNQEHAWRLDDDGADLEDEHDGGEPDVDAEPSLGATLATNQERAGWQKPAEDDFEEDRADFEPSLGATNDGSQNLAWDWAGRRSHDLEADGPDGRDADAEPSLASPEVSFAGRGFDTAIGGLAMVGGRQIMVRIDPRDSGLDQGNWARGGSCDFEQDRSDWEPDDDCEATALETAGRGFAPSVAG